MTIYDLAPSSPLLPLETEGDTYSPASCSSNAPLKPYLATELTVRFKQATCLTFATAVPSNRKLSCSDGSETLMNSDDIPPKMKMEVVQRTLLWPTLDTKFEKASFSKFDSTAFPRTKDAFIRLSERATEILSGRHFESDQDSKTGDPEMWLEMVRRLYLAEDILQERARTTPTTSVSQYPDLEVPPSTD